MLRMRQFSWCVSFRGAPDERVRKWDVDSALIIARVGDSGAATSRLAHSLSVGRVPVGPLWACGGRGRRTRGRCEAGQGRSGQVRSPGAVLGPPHPSLHVEHLAEHLLRLRVLAYDIEGAGEVSHCTQ